MKNRRNVVVAFLLVAVLLLGVGYAALTDTLTIIGNAHIDMGEAQNTFDEKVYFSDSKVVAGTKGSGTKEDVASHSDDDATFTANSLAVKDDKVSFLFTIKNDSNVSVDISIASTKLSGDVNPSNSNEQKFKVTYEYPDGKTITSGGTITVKVTVEVIAPITSATSATFGIELTATTIEPTNP